MSTNVKRATRKGLLPDYHSILAIIFNIIHVFFSKTFLFFFCFRFFKDMIERGMLNTASRLQMECLWFASLQHGGQIRSSSCVTSRESGLFTIK